MSNIYLFGLGGDKLPDGFEPPENPFGFLFPFWNQQGGSSTEGKNVNAGTILNQIQSNYSYQNTLNRIIENLKYAKTSDIPNVPSLYDLLVELQTNINGQSLLVSILDGLNYAKKKDIPTVDLSNYLTLQDLANTLSEYAKLTDIPSIPSLYDRMVALQTDSNSLSILDSIISSLNYAKKTDIPNAGDILRQISLNQTYKTTLNSIISSMGYITLSDVPGTGDILSDIRKDIGMGEGTSAYWGTIHSIVDTVGFVSDDTLSDDILSDEGLINAISGRLGVSDIQTTLDSLTSDLGQYPVILGGNSTSLSTLLMGYSKDISDLWTSFNGINTMTENDLKAYLGLGAIHGIRPIHYKGKSFKDWLDQTSVNESGLINAVSDISGINKYLHSLSGDFNDNSGSYTFNSDLKNALDGLNVAFTSDILTNEDIEGIIGNKLWGSSLVKIDDLTDAVWPYRFDIADLSGIKGNLMAIAGPDALSPQTVPDEILVKYVSRDGMVFADYNEFVKHTNDLLYVDPNGEYYLPEFHIGEYVAFAPACDGCNSTTINEFNSLSDSQTFKSNRDAEGYLTTPPCYDSERGVYYVLAMEPDGDGNYKKFKVLDSDNSPGTFQFNSGEGVWTSTFDCHQYYSIGTRVFPNLIEAYVFSDVFSKMTVDEWYNNHISHLDFLTQANKDYIKSLLVSDAFFKFYGYKGLSTVLIKDIGFSFAGGQNYLKVPTSIYGKEVLSQSDISNLPARFKDLSDEEKRAYFFQAFNIPNKTEFENALMRFRQPKSYIAIDGTVFDGEAHTLDEVKAYSLNLLNSMIGYTPGVGEEWTMAPKFNILNYLTQPNGIAMLYSLKDFEEDNRKGIEGLKLSLGGLKKSLDDLTKEVEGSEAEFKTDLSDFSDQLKTTLTKYATTSYVDASKNDIYSNIGFDISDKKFTNGSIFIPVIPNLISNEIKDKDSNIYKSINDLVSSLGIADSMKSFSLSYLDIDGLPSLSIGNFMLGTYKDLGWFEDGLRAVNGKFSDISTMIEPLKDEINDKFSKLVSLNNAVKDSSKYFDMNAKGGFTWMGDIDGFQSSINNVLTYGTYSINHFNDLFSGTKSATYHTVSTHGHGIVTNTVTKTFLDATNSLFNFGTTFGNYDWAVFKIFMMFVHDSLYPALENLKSFINHGVVAFNELNGLIEDMKNSNVPVSVDALNSNLIQIKSLFDGLASISLPSNGDFIPDVVPDNFKVSLPDKPSLPSGFNPPNP